jgi:hypothetical protein
MWPLKKKKVLSFEEFQAERSGTPVQETPEQGGEILSFEQFKAQKGSQEQSAQQPLGFEDFRSQSKARPFGDVMKPAETKNTQIKPVDQIEHEASFGEKAVSAGIAYMGSVAGGLSRMGTAIESKGKIMQQDEDPNAMSRQYMGRDLTPEELQQQEKFGESGQGKIAETVQKKVGAGLEYFGGGMEGGYAEREKGYQEDPRLLKEYQNFRGEDGRLDPSKFADVGTYMNVIAQGVGSFVPGAMALIATKNPLAAGATMGMMEKGDAVQEYAQKIAEEKGVSVEELTPEDLKRVDTASDYYGAASAVLESAFPGLLSKIVKGGGGGVIKSTLMAIPTEGGTEGIQRFTQNLIAKVSEVNPDQELSEGVLDEAIAGALTGSAIAAPTAIMGGGESNPDIVPTEEKPFSGITPTNKTEELISSLEEGEDVEEIVAGMSKKELEEVSTALQTASQTDGVTEEQMATLEEFSSVVNERLQGRVESMAELADAVLSGETPIENLPLSDREQVRSIIEQVKTAASPEEQAGIEEALASLSTDRLDGVEKASELDNESSPFYETQDEDSVANTFADLATPLQDEISTLSEKKRDYLAQKQAATTPEEKRSLQTMIDAIDEEKRSYQTDLSILEEQAGSKNLVLLQNTVDKIKAIEPSFSVATAVDNRWTTADYKKHLASIKPQKENSSQTQVSVTKKEEKKEPVKSSEKVAKESQNTEKKEVTKKDSQVKSVEPSFSKTFAFEQMNEKGFDVKVASDFETLDESSLSLSKKDLTKAWEKRTGLKLQTNEDGDITLYRGGESPEIGAYQYLINDKEAAAQYGEVREYSVDPKDISWSEEEQAFLFEPRDGNKKITPAMAVFNEDILIDYVPFSVKKTGSKRRISKEEKTAREAMQDAVAASLFDDKIWSRVLRKTGSEFTSFEDYAVLEELKNQLESGKKIDFEMVRAGYEALARYGVPVADLTLANMPDEEVTKNTVLTVHNLSEQKLRFSDKIGGLANPSMATLDPSKTDFSYYGEVSLIPKKSIIRGEKTYLSDAYSPRFPYIVSSTSYQNMKSLNEELDPFIQELEGNGAVGDNNDNVGEAIKNSIAVQLKFLRENEIQPVESPYNYINQIETSGLYDEFVDFAENLAEKYDVKYSIFDGYTNSGRRKYKTLSVEEASRVMNKDKDGEMAFFNKVGKIKALLVKSKKSPEQLAKEKNKLSSKEDFLKIAREVDDELSLIQEDLSKYATNTDSNPFSEISNQYDVIGNLMTEKDGRYYFDQKFKDVPQSIFDRIAVLKQRIIDTPTEYFETKFKRPVYLNEFAKALVPKTASKKTRDILEKNGIEVIEYEEGKRQDAMKELLADNEIAFKASEKPQKEPLLNSSEAFVRGLDNVKSELLSRVHGGDITTRDYQEMSHFLDMVSPLVQNMAVSVAEQTDADTADGMYDWISDTVSLFRNIGDSEQLKQTFYHEVGHHVSRFIPKEMLAELNVKFTMEKGEFLDKNPQFQKAEKLQHGEKMAYYANHNPDENYKYFNLDEYFAEMIRTKSMATIQEELGTKPDSFVMQVVAYAKQLINAMKEVMAIFRGKDVSDRIFELVTSGESLEEVNSFGLVSSIEKGMRSYKAMLQSRRSILYAAYQRNIDKLSPAEAIAFEKAFNKSVDVEAVHEAVDVLIRNGIKTTAFYRSAAKVRKLAEQKYKGAFVDPKLADEYMRIIDSQAELLVQERGYLEEVKMMEEFGDMLPDDQEQQLDSFIELIKNTRGKNREILQNGDFEQIEKVMAEKGFAPADAGNMFYSFQEEDYNQVLDKFRAIIMQRDPAILVGKKAVVNLGMKKMKETALENLQNGKSQFSDQFKNYQKELESILKESAVQFTKEDLDFIDASKKLKNELYTLRREKEKQRLMRAGSTLGKSVQRAQFATRLKDFRDRKNKVRFAKEFFGLSDSQFRKIGGNTPVQYLTEEQFDNFMKRIEGAAANESERSFYIKTIYKTIKEKELRKWQNLQKAWKMPKIENMTIDQLKEFSAAMDMAKEKDTFLTQRQIETVDNTELKGIKTLNEGRERLAERMGVPVSQVSNLSAGELDRFRYDTALAEQNVFYQILVDDTNREFLLGETRFLDKKKQVNKLIKAARRSRPRSVGDYFVPTDTRIFEYLESENKAEKAKDMTEAELKAAEYIREKYEEVLNYLIEKKMLDKFRENYITHVRKTFLETWKDNGFLKAIKGVFDEYQEQEATFNILDGDTGEILPMEKFFQFSLARTGALDPTQNVARAFLAYMQTFEKKRAFDAVIPKMEIYTDALMAEKRTKGGLLFDRSLKKLVREWINNKKGRRNSLGGIVRQGGKIDLLLRFGNTFVTLMDLGFSIPTGLASHVGEQVTNFVQMGAKMIAKGTIRMATPKGRAMLKRYENFTGENPWSHLVEAADTAGDVLSKSMFVLFRNSQWLANQQYLLGSLTDQEWKSGELSDTRIAVLKREMGRWRVVEGAESVYGSTSVGKVGSKYKAWAVPILRSTADNIVKVAKNKKLLHSKEGQELIRSGLVIAVALLAGMLLIEDKDKREKDKTFLEKMRDKAIRDALSTFQVFDMSFWLGTPRLADYLYDFAVAVKQVVSIDEQNGEKVLGERYKTSKKGEYEAGDLKGLNAMQRSLTPTAVKQFIPPSE